MLQGLSDEAEAVREISLRAGQSIVNQYATTSLAQLLPPLEAGLFDDNWRIRQSALSKLLGDLLAKIIGKTEDTEASNLAVIKGLGREKRDKILAALYIIRQDTSSQVRQKGSVGVEECGFKYSKDFERDSANSYKQHYLLLSGKPEPRQETSSQQNTR